LTLLHKTILKNRNMEHVADIDRFTKIDEERRDLIAKTEKLRQKRNAVSKEVGKRRANNQDDSDLRQLLSWSDLLYGHFPDPERVMALEDDALRRVAAEAAYWRGRIEAALKTLNG
jgi:hypothetical protein